MGTLLFTLLLTALVSESSCVQWSSSALKEDAAVYTCDNSDLTLSWDVSKTTGETIVDVQWFYEGRSQEMIAILSHGHLNVMPSFSGRVELTANAGIVIHHVTTGEKGNYSVEVNAQDKNGGYVTLRRKASVLVGDGLMTTDGHLHASQMAVAVFSNFTQQWHVALACGTFTYHDTPPFTVEWTTPSGQSVSSSQYKEGQFLLLLDNPVSGGSYSCHVPHSSASVACLLGDSTDVSSTIVVDDVKSRLTLLETENQQLKGSVMELKAENGQLKGHLVDVSNEVTGLKAKDKQLEDHLGKQGNQTNDRINNVANQTNDRINNVANQTNDHINYVTNQTTARIDSVSSLLSQHLHDERTKRVSFHAIHLKDTTPSSGDVLIPTTVHNNQGNGYNSATGKFTAPYNGTYCFMSSLFGYGSGHHIEVSLMVDGKQDLVLYTDFGSAGDYDAASLQGVVSVRAGQSVWLEADGGHNQFSTGSHANSFSGFLVSYHL
ncbi:uncharacterized protein [Littorina saxatilis]|uniref:Uncharacterized protein n=1 Tax=Littorina saxatilis TaxID=31220 RepID=A0AAN9BFS0_9CAEN